MSASQKPLKVTPPSSFAQQPLTPPPSDEKPFTQALRVIALFNAIKAGRHGDRNPWTCFQLAEGEYGEIQRRLARDEELLRYTEDKIRYDYFGTSHQLVVRMPTGIHERFIARVEDAIYNQLKRICDGSDRAARFAQEVHPARSTSIYLPVEDALPGTQSKHDPDTSFWHEEAEFPGVIIEVSYSTKRKQLNRLAEEYLLDSDASVQVVVGLDIEYGRKASRKATLSVWRTLEVHTADGDELRVVQEVADEAFRDDQGNPTEHPGLRLRLRDFAYARLADDELGNEDRELVITGQQLCQFLNNVEVTETKARHSEKRRRNSIAPGIKKRKRTRTPPEQITSGDEAKFVEREERAAKRAARDDPDYEDV